MTQFGGISGEHLRQYIARIEKLEEDKKSIADDLREVYAEAKSQGFDTRIMRQLIRIRKMEPNDLYEQEELLDLYKHALGMAVSQDVEEASMPADVVDA